MTKHLARGVWPVMLTPFNAHNEIDYQAFDQLIEWYLDHGVAGLFAMCQSSEMDFLSIEEKQRLLSHLMNRVQGRVPVVAAGMPTGNSAAYAQFCQDIGISALILLPNRLVTEQQDESACWESIQRLIDTLPEIDLGLYECPLPYHRLMSADLVKQCAHTGRFVFLKETSCVRQELAEKLQACQGTRLQIYPAHGPSVLFGLQHGASGSCNIAANFIPQLYAELCQHWKNSEATDVQSLLTLLDPHVRLGYPANAKRWLQLSGIDMSDSCRCEPPKIKMDDEAMRFDAIKQSLHQWTPLPIS